MFNIKQRISLLAELFMKLYIPNLMFFLALHVQNFISWFSRADVLYIPLIYQVRWLGDWLVTYLFS